MAYNTKEETNHCDCEMFGNFDANIPKSNNEYENIAKIIKKQIEKDEVYNIGIIAPFAAGKSSAIKKWKDLLTEDEKNKVCDITVADFASMFESGKQPLSKKKQTIKNEIINKEDIKKEDLENVEEENADTNTIPSTHNAIEIIGRDIVKAEYKEFRLFALNNLKLISECKKHKILVYSVDDLDNIQNNTCVIKYLSIFAAEFADDYIKGKYNYEKYIKNIMQDKLFTIEQKSKMVNSIPDDFFKKIIADSSNKYFLEKLCEVLEESEKKNLLIKKEE